MIPNEILSTVLPILHKHHVLHARVFGSYASGMQGPESDLDMIVEMPPEKTYFDLGMLQSELKTALRKDVDLMFDGTPLHSNFRKSIEAHQVQLF